MPASYTHHHNQDTNCSITPKHSFLLSIWSQFSSVQLLSRVWLFATPWTAIRLPCPTPTPRSFSNSCPSSQWCHPTISSSVIPFSCLQYFPGSESFLMSQFFASGGQRIGASTSASVLPMNIQDWFPLGWTGWMSLLSKRLSRVFSNTTFQKHQFFCAQPSLSSNSHTRTHCWKNQSFYYTTFIGKVMSLLFKMLSRFVIAFLSRSKHLLISWL